MLTQWLIDTDLNTDDKNILSRQMVTIIITMRNDNIRNREIGRIQAEQHKMTVHV